MRWWVAFYAGRVDFPHAPGLTVLGLFRCCGGIIRSTECIAWRCPLLLGPIVYVDHCLCRPSSAGRHSGTTFIRRSVHAAAAAKMYINAVPVRTSLGQQKYACVSIRCCRRRCRHGRLFHYRRYTMPSFASESERLCPCQVNAIFASRVSLPVNASLRRRLASLMCWPDERDRKYRTGKRRTE